MSGLVQAVLDAVEFVDVSRDFAVLAVQGPRSRELLAPLVAGGLLGPATDLGTLTPEQATAAAADVDKTIPFSTALEDVTVAGVPGVSMLRITFVGELGFELHIPAARAAEVYRAVRAAAAELERRYAGSRVRVLARDCGYRAMDSLSAEKGYRHWHADLANSDSPLEAAIGFTVLPRLKATTAAEDPFSGRAALEKQRDEGVAKRLVCLTLNDADDSEPFCATPPNAAPLHGSETIWRDEECVGIVRSTAFGHATRATIVYGYVHRAPGGPKLLEKWLDAGKWSVGDKGVRRAASLQLKAPFDPSNIRLRAIEH